MLDYAEPIDVATSAELQRIAEQVAETGHPVPLTRDGQIVAVIQPAPALDTTGATQPSNIWAGYDPAKALAGLRASAGALAGVDREELLADIHAQRGQDSQGRPGD